MFEIALHKLGKKYKREWIFRNVDVTLHSGDCILIEGGNGSGKSTLLQSIAGFITPTEGKVEYSQSGTVMSQEEQRHCIALASPYLQLIEDFSAPELIEHLSKAKPFVSGLSSEEVLEIARLSHAKHKYIRHFSSGMKQRLKLALAFLADTPVLMLDEPLSNLDKEGERWYRQMIATYGADRLVLVCSNAISEEHFFCTKTINVMLHK